MTTKTAAGVYEIEHNGHAYRITYEPAPELRPDTPPMRGNRWIATRDGAPWGQFERLTNAEIAAQDDYVTDGESFPVGARVAFRQADDDRRVTAGQTGTVVWSAPVGMAGRDVELADGRVVNVPSYELDEPSEPAPAAERWGTEPAPADPSARGHRVTAQDKRRDALWAIGERWHPAPAAADTLPTRPGELITLDRRDEIAADILTLVELGRTDRWRGAIAEWARQVRESGTLDHLVWAWFQYSVWAGYAA